MQPRKKKILQDGMVRSVGQICCGLYLSMVLISIFMEKECVIASNSASGRVNPQAAVKVYLKDIGELWDVNNAYSGTNTFEAKLFLVQLNTQVTKDEKTKN